MKNLLKLIEIDKKFLEGGKKYKKKQDDIKENKPIIINAIFQENCSASILLKNLPEKPPIVFPLIYKPIQNDKELGCISSLIYVIATATTPLNARPVNERSKTILVQLVIIEHIIVNIDAINKETDIIDFLPITSDNGPVKSIPKAIVIVAAERDKLLSAGVK